ncbi:F0F1 ATP synthase subunit epsilon [Dysgonomonas sp. 520]|uniref:F0F1 ATP synthase subunit epsilon n=1 Tax=Dysgonomonas sp. 520 TaxID=2302931 RepID=UPI0013CFD40D|nr:hypothetical protein [Dysgonomonas sp. 520]NDW10610.1 hypothetical protein [Dysgonomonas sp. 520]
MKELELKLISAEKSLFEGKVAYVMLPGTEGNFSIHPNHAPLISSLKAGEIEYGTSENADDVKKVSVNSGFVEILKNVVTVCIE